MKPEYVASKSLWIAVKPIRGILFFALIAIIYMVCNETKFENYITSLVILDILIWISCVIVNFVSILSIKIEFYNDKIISKSGVLTKRIRKTMFSGVISVSVTQSLFGRLLDYGDVVADITGVWNIDTTDIENPKGLLDYLETRIITPSESTMTVVQA